MEENKYFLVLQNKYQGRPRWDIGPAGHLQPDEIQGALASHQETDSQVDTPHRGLSAHSTCLPARGSEDCFKPDYIHRHTPKQRCLWVLGEWGVPVLGIILQAEVGVAWSGQAAVTSAALRMQTAALDLQQPRNKTFLVLTLQTRKLKPRTSKEFILWKNREKPGKFPGWRNGETDKKNETRPDSLSKL